MRVNIQVRAGDVVRTFDVQVEALADLEAPFATFNKIKRKEIQARFDAGGPGWPAKKSGQGSGGAKSEGASGSEAADAAAKQLADEMLHRKLKNELRRAKRKYARGRGSAAAMERRYRVLQEYERLVASDNVESSAPQLSHTDPKLEKSLRGLRARHQRAVVKARNRPLGRISQSMRSKIAQASIEIYSEVRWSKVHNDGGEAGRGAQEPERKFLEVTEDDIRLLTQLIEEHTRFSAY